VTGAAAAALAALAGQPPVDVGRTEARRQAQDELARHIYHADDPSLVQRALLWAGRGVGHLLDRAAGATSGGYGGLLVLLVLLVVVVVVVRLRVGPVARRAPSEQPLFASTVRSADEHRRAAEAHAAAGRWAEAVREALRAVVRDLEQRALVESRPGRTADEAAADAGRALPAHADALRDAARAFDDVWYGQHPAVADTYRRIRDLDERVRRASPTAVGSAP